MANPIDTKLDPYSPYKSVEITGRKMPRLRDTNPNPMSQKGYRFEDAIIKRLAQIPMALIIREPGYEVVTKKEAHIARLLYPDLLLKVNNKTFLIECKLNFHYGRNRRQMSNQYHAVSQHERYTNSGVTPIPVIITTSASDTFNQEIATIDELLSLEPNFPHFNILIVPRGAKHLS